MERSVTIDFPAGGKTKIPLDTYHAIRRAIKIYDRDTRVVAYASAPHEGVTPCLVAHIRRRMIIYGHLPERAFSRRGERKHG